MSLPLRLIPEVAAFASARSLMLIESNQSTSEEHLQAYWKCCRGRTIDWLKTLDDLECRLANASPDEHQATWLKLEPILSEIFVSEILTRVWGITLTALDRHRGTRSAEPIARNTTSGHTHVRNRALSLMVNSVQVPMTQMATVDRLRRKAERWTDLLVGHLALRYQLPQFAFENQRSLDFGQSQLHEFVQATDESVWEFVIAGIRLAFSKLSNDQGSSQPWNRGIVSSILGSFPVDCFDEAGLFKSLRRIRIERPTAERSPAPIGSPSVPTESPRIQVRFTELKHRFGADYR